jgi:hypothetical protein
MSRRARRRLIAATILLVLAALAAFAFGVVSGSSRDPLPLLATRPALPPTFIDATLGPGALRISWREEEGVHATKHACGLGRGAIRSWSDGGDPVNTPDAFETVCVYRTPLLAWAVYRWQSLHRVAGEDWPNFEAGSDAPTVPTNVSALENLRADEWEVGCGIGDPDALCGVWTFRARYDEVLLVTEVRTIDPGIGFASVRRFVESVDRNIAAKMRTS